jgi:hypothetical protein
VQAASSRPRSSRARFHGSTPPPNFSRKKEGWGFEFGEAGTSGEITCQEQIFSVFIGASPPCGA